MSRVARAVACAAALAMAGFSVGAQQQTAATEISTLLQDAQTLAASGIPFGFVLGREDSLSMQVWRPARAANAAVSPEALIADFGADWRERFHVAEADGVVSAVSTRASVCTAALRRPVKAQTVTGSPVEVLFAMMRELDPALQRLPPPGVVSGGPVAPVGQPDPITTTVTVRVPDGPLQAGLDRIVTTAQRLGWIVSEDRCGDAGRCACVVAFVTGTTLVQTSYDITAGSR